MKVVVHTYNSGTQTLSNIDPPSYPDDFSGFHLDNGIYSVSNKAGESLVVPWTNVTSILFVNDDEESSDA